VTSIRKVSDFDVVLHIESSFDTFENTCATLVAERIQKELALPFDLSGREVYTSVSIGIALDIGYELPEEILRDADTAMYRAKQLGKARYQSFDKEMHSAAMNVLEVETDLRTGIDREEFFVHYQPIMSLNNERLVGFEALVRWHHPDRRNTDDVRPRTHQHVTEQQRMSRYIRNRSHYSAHR
jgi:predicted signal transduction protein with EAL and GGDEF domain